MVYIKGVIVCHCLTDKQKQDFRQDATIDHISSAYAQAIRNMKPLGGKKFHKKVFGGGIAFEEFSSTKDLEMKISEVLKTIQ